MMHTKIRKSHQTKLAFESEKAQLYISFTLRRKAVGFTNSKWAIGSKFCENNDNDDIIDLNRILF
jgi:hypothetical protein